MKILYRFLNKMKNSLTRGNNNEKIDYRTLLEMTKTDSNIILLDVRNAKEFSEGHLLGAINIPLSELEAKSSFLLPNKGQTIIVYCQMGGRSKKAGNILRKLGYTSVYELDGGLDGI